MAYSVEEKENAKKILLKGLPNESLFVVVNENFQKEKKQKKP